MTRVNVANWDEELQALAGEYSPGYVLTAFKVKRELEKNGYRGIDFTGAAETYLRKHAPMVVQRKMEKQLNKELRRKGLK